MMALGANRALWWHTASLQATMMNLFLPKGKKAISPEMLHPCLEKKAPFRIRGKGLNILKEVFCREQITKERKESTRSISQKKS